MTTNDILDSVKAGQQKYAQAVNSGTQAWLDALDQGTRAVSEGIHKISAEATEVKPDQVIDQVFDFLGSMLEGQRQFAKNLAASAGSAAERLRRDAAPEQPDPSSN